MKIGPLRTIALCATCAALAGAGSAALAADEDGPGTTAAPPERAGQTLMRQCVLDPASKAGEGQRDEKCKVTSGGAPPPGGKPVFGGCVKLAPGTDDKTAGDATEKKRGAIECKVTSGGAPPPDGKPPFGRCEKVEPGTGDRAAAAAAKQKMAAIAKEKAAAAAGS